MGMLVEGVWQDQWYDTKSTRGRFVRRLNGSGRVVAVKFRPAGLCAFTPEPLDRLPGASTDGEAGSSEKPKPRSCRQTPVPGATTPLPKDL